MENYLELLQRAKRVGLGILCVFVAFVLVNKGNSTNDYTTVPLMYVTTALMVGLTGIAMMVQGWTSK